MPISAIADPPLKLVLIETAAARGTGPSGALNHLGVEVDSTEEVRLATARFSGDGLATTEESETTCCYAVQDKVWVADPDEAPWEIYTVLSDAPAQAGPCGEEASICCQLQEASAVAGCC